MDSRTSTGLRRDFGAGPGAADPPRRRPFSRAEGSYKRLGSQVSRVPSIGSVTKHRERDLTRRGPEARRISRKNKMTNPSKTVVFIEINGTNISFSPRGLKPFGLKHVDSGMLT